MSTRNKNLFTLAKKKQSTKEIAKAEAIKVLKKRTELKYHNTQQYFGTLDLNGYIMDLSDMAIGNTDSTRNGDRVCPVSLRVRSRASPTADGFMTAGLGQYRIIVFRWNRSTTPAVGDVLQNGPGTPYGIIAQYQHDQRNEFNILYDHVVQCTTDNYGYSSKYLRLAPKQIDYTAAGTQGSFKLYAIIINDKALAYSPVQPAMDFRLNYTDM